MSDTKPLTKEQIESISKDKMNYPTERTLNNILFDFYVKGFLGRNTLVLDPFSIVPPDKITDEHIDLVRKCASGFKETRKILDGNSQDLDSLLILMCFNYLHKLHLKLSQDEEFTPAIVFCCYALGYPQGAWENGKYKFQSWIDLWNLGLVPIFNCQHNTWEIYGGRDVMVLWSGII